MVLRFVPVDSDGVVEAENVGNRVTNQTVPRITVGAHACKGFKLKLTNTN